MKPALRTMAAVVAAVWLASPDTAWAGQDKTARRAGGVDIPLMERSRLFRNLPNDDTGEIYEGFIAVHFPLGGSMQESYDDARKQKAPDWAWLPSFSMMSNIRQLEEDSAPVRSPSYMPRLRFTAVKTSVIPFAIEEDTTTTQLILEGTVGHYSNGQSGCLLEQQTGDDCELPAGVDDDDLVVRRGGSFSSHYVEAGIGYRWLRWSDTLQADTRQGTRRILGVYARLRDYNLMSSVPGGMDADLRRLYGATRVRAGADYVCETAEPGCKFGISWIGGWAEYANGSARAVEGVRFAVEVGRTSDWLGGTGFFVRYYNGHDDYNAAFLNSLNVLHVGVSLGGERRPSVK